MRVVRASGAGARAAARRLASGDTVDWRSLVHAGRGEVWLARDPGEPRGLIVKIERGEGLKGWTRTALGLGPRRRAWAWGRRLAHADLVAPPIALVAGRLRDGPRYQATLTPELPGPTLLEALDDRAAARDHAADAGGLLARLLAHGVWTRDAKPSNLMYARDVRSGDRAADARQLRLIDLDGLRALRPAPEDHRQAAVRMLASLLIEPLGVGRGLSDASADAAADALARGMGAPTDPGALLASARAIVERHGDPTPARDPRQAERRRRA